eukprot:7166164-Prymnesium_polylepis.2
MPSPGYLQLAQIFTCIETSMCATASMCAMLSNVSQPFKPYSSPPVSLVSWKHSVPPVPQLPLTTASPPSAACVQLDEEHVALNSVDHGSTGSGGGGGSGGGDGGTIGDGGGEDGGTIGGGRG